jgi:hypothetical protein
MHRLFGLLASGLIFIAMPIHADTPAALIGDWEVRHTAAGIGHIYTFQTNGTYEYNIFSILPGITKVIKSEAGAYAVQGDRLTLKPRGGNSKTYRWQLTRDPYVRDRILWLEDSNGGREQFYGSR